MTRQLTLSLLLVLLLVAHRSALPATPATPEVWFFLRGYAMTAHGVDGQQGWRKLFLEPNAPWPQFMDHVQVVALAGNIAATPDEVYAKAFAKLNDKHIGIAIESLAQSWVGFPEHCGKGVEGLPIRRETPGLPARSKRRGASSSM